MNKTFEYKGETLHVVLNHYSSNLCLSVEVHSGTKPYARVSVNLEGLSENIPRDCFYAKHWGGQKPIINAMIESGLIKETEYPTGASGFVSEIKAYKISEKLKNICSVCENWLDDSIILTECEICLGKFCAMCGNTSSKICIHCEEYSSFDYDEDMDEDKEPSRDIGFTKEDREAFAISDALESIEEINEEEWEGDD
jgi:hypothetical protein